MAEITSNSKRKVAKPDMTPMVDLGFLLITFFMYTTTFSSPVAMSYFQPIEDDTVQDVAQSNTLSFLLGEENQLFWHQETNKTLSNEKLHMISYFSKELRQMIVNSRNHAKKEENFTVIIKPTEKSSYKNVVDIMDEMLITNQQHYAVVEPTKEITDRAIKNGG